MRTDDPVADSYAHSLAESAKTTYEERKCEYIECAIGDGGEFDVTNAETMQAAFFDMSRDDAAKITGAAKHDRGLMCGAIMDMVERYARHRAEVEWLATYADD